MLVVETIPSDPDRLSRAVEILRSGGVVAFPTETVYGLGADAMNPEAVGRVFALKGRPAHNPLIVHVTGPEMVGVVASDWPPEAEALARAFWPGPLSIVVPRRIGEAGKRGVPDAVAAGGPTVAVRSPDHPLALALLFAFGGPLVGPSANPSGRVSPTRAEHVREAFSEQDVFVLDGGPCERGIESTVVRVDRGGAAILRPGVIGAEAIGAVLGRRVEVTQPAGGVLQSPGMLTSHYAPRARLVLFDDAEWPGVLERAGGPVAVVTHRRRTAPPPHSIVLLPGDAAGYAASLYAAIREADHRSPALIAVERPPAGRADADGAIWDAVHDRLSRAAATRD